MGNAVKSMWTVTFDPGGSNQLILVSDGDMLEEEIEIANRQDTEDGKYPGASNAEPATRGGITRDLELRVYKTHASLAAARAYVLSQSIAVPANTRATLRFVITGGNTYNLSNAVFTDWSVRPVRTGVHKTLATYRLRGGALAAG
jgi:hypothetical protein